MEHERWSLQHEGRLHEVYVRRRLLVLDVAWHVNGEIVAEKNEWDDSVILTPSDETSMLGAIGVKGPKMLSATRRVVLHPGTVPDEPDPDSEEGEEGEPPLSAAGALTLSYDRGTRDLVPDQGTRGARRQDWILRHPRLHIVRETFSAGGAVLWGVIFFGVVVPLIDLVMPDVNGPDINAPDINLPSITWPDLPSIPWPDLPSIPWPDLPDVPDWVGTVVKLLFAVALAGLVASGEVKRRRDREAERAHDDQKTSGPHNSSSDSSSESSSD